MFLDLSIIFSILLFLNIVHFYEISFEIVVSLLVKYHYIVFAGIFPLEFIYLVRLLLYLFQQLLFSLLVDSLLGLLGMLVFNDARTGLANEAALTILTCLLLVLLFQEIFI